MVRLALLSLFLLAGCTHSVHLVHMSDFSTHKKLSAGKWISSETSQTVILGLVGQTDYVNEARGKLIKQCPNGSIQGITTRYSTSHSFLSWENKIYMQGLCL